MNENTKNTLKGISKIVLTIMAYRTYDVARVISAILCLMAAHQQITAGKATFFLVVVLYLFTYPIISAIIYLLLLIPKYISKFILMFMKGGSETGFDGFNDYSDYGYGNSDGYYDYNGYSGYDRNDYGNQNYSNHQYQNNYSQNTGNNHQNSNSSDDNYNRAYEEFKRQYNQYYYQKNNANSGNSNQNSNRGNSYNNSQSSGSAAHVSDYEKALKFYGLKVPFTEKELKGKRRKMMKTAHPDAGGSTNEAETINQYYDILKKYAN